MSAIDAGLLALVRAYRLRFADAPGLPSEAELIEPILQQLLSAHSESFFSTLDELPGAVSIKPSELAELLRMAIGADECKRSLANSEQEADTAFGLWTSAKRILSDPQFGKTRARRYSRALYELGLVAEKNGEGRIDPTPRRAAELYFLLRTGGHTHENGCLVEVDPCSHDDAVQAVMSRLDISDWDSLERAWRRIEEKTGRPVHPRYNAEVYPVK